MADAGEISMERWLDVALNPIGSLALVERFDENTASLLRTFNMLCPKLVDMILSPYGFRIVEYFLTVDEVYVRLAESLSKEWSGLEKVLKSEKGRYVCETLLKKKMKLFAHKIITIAPRDWWFKNVEALTILTKAITFSDVDIAKKFIFHGQMVIDLCDTPEGLYCVLKVLSQLMDQPGWKDALANLIVFKSQSIAGSEALSQAILYGDYLVNEVIEIIFFRRESFDNSITVSLIIRIVEQGSDSVKELIVNCLCQPNVNPVISQIRKTKRFEDFKKACDSNFTLSQRKRLDNHMTSTRVRSVVDDCLTTNESESMNTPDGQNKKRRSGAHVTSHASAKRPREEVAAPLPSSSHTTVPSLSAVPQVPTVSLPPTVTTPSTVPSHPTVTTQPTVASAATVRIPSTTPSAKPPSTPTVSSTIPPPPSTPAVPVERLMAIQRTDPGKDVISMAMGEKYSKLLSKLAKGTPKLRLTVFNCIRDALLSLMMNERGSEVVKWFIVNGTVKQRGEIERKVEENMDDLVTNGGYGGAIAALVIDNCADSEKKKELSEKSMKAMESTRNSSASAVETECDEVEIVSHKINKKPAEKSTVAKVLGVKDIRPRYRVVTFRDEDEIRRMFEEIDHKMRQRRIADSDIELFITHAVRMAKDGVSQLFIDLVQERVATWVTSECGTRFLHGLTVEKLLRPHLVYAVASVLHLLFFCKGRSIVATMLSKLTRPVFAYYCISNNDDSPIVKLFRAEMMPDHCLGIGLEFVKVFPDRMRDFLGSPTGRTIAGYENGRRFIELLTKPRPEGHAWFELLQLIPATPIDRSSHNDGIASNTAENRPMETSTPTVKTEAEETSANEKSNVEKQAIDAARTTVVPPHEDTVASSQVDTVATPDYISAPSANDDRWRQLLREENGVVSIVPGLYLSNEERLKIAVMFSKIDIVLKWRWPTLSEKQEFIACGRTKDGVSQLFIDRIRGIVTSNPRWAHWMSNVAQNKELRPYLIAPVASVLHGMSWPSALLDTMILTDSREAFINACLEGNDNSPFVRLFKSVSNNVHCVEIGMQIAKAMPDRVRLSIASGLGQSIAETVKGRQFFESLAKPPPEGCGWMDLLDHENRVKEAIVTSRSTVVAPLERAVSASQLDTVASPHQNTVATPAETATTRNATQSLLFDALPPGVPPFSTFLYQD